MPQVRRAEYHKKPGVCYAVTDDGLELPVVDVTHPAFDLTLSEAKEHAMLARFLDEQRRFARLPSLLRGALMRFFTRGSLMARGLRRAEGTFLDGMTTYLFKVGAKNLGSYSVPVDRRIAASLPALSVRLRLGDVARLLADALAPQLRAEPGRPLVFLNIAGGPAIDSLNALLLLQREARGLIGDRHCRVLVLDADEHGPAFGARALAALRDEGAPLSGLRLELTHTPYDWREPSRLAEVVASVRDAGAICVGSSEGGLFEYGSDADILGNLRALAALGDAFRMVGSVTRDDETIRTLKLTSTAATRPRGLAVFAALIAQAGWTLRESVSRPLSDQVVIAPSA
jgi:hypothetical protein